MNKIEELEAELVDRPRHWTVGVSQSDLRKLLAVVKAAQGIKQREDIGGYGHEGHDELFQALAALGGE